MNRRKPGHRVMPDLVGRTFTADRPNRVYVGVNDRGKVHVLAALTRQVGDVAYIDAVRPVSCECTAY